MSDNGDSINKRIAIAKGYRVEVQSITKRHVLARPDGGQEMSRDSDDEAWLELSEDWQHDLKLALGLFEGDTSFRLVAAPVPHGELLNWQIRARKKIYGEYVGSGDQVWIVQSLDEISERLCLLWLFLNEPQVNIP